MVGQAALARKLRGELLMRLKGNQRVWFSATDAAKASAWPAQFVGVQRRSGTLFVWMKRKLESVVTRPLCA